VDPRQKTIEELDGLGSLITGNGGVLEEFKGWEKTTITFRAGREREDGDREEKQIQVPIRKTWI